VHRPSRRCFLVGLLWLWAGLGPSGDWPGAQQPWSLARSVRVESEWRLLRLKRVLAAEHTGCWLQAKALSWGPLAAASQTALTRGRQLFWDAKRQGRRAALIGWARPRRLGQGGSQRKM